MKSFGEVVRKTREQQGLTQYALAKQAGFPGQTTLKAIEDSERDPQFSTCVKIADALGVTLDYLVEQMRDGK